MQINESIQAKAYAKIMGLERKVDKYANMIGQCENIGHEQIQIVIDATQREIELWRHIATLAEQDELGLVVAQQEHIKQLTEQVYTLLNLSLIHI